jgi:undecaprenyl-diphosphatase
MTWHAAQFLFLQALALALAAALGFIAWAIAHRGHAIARSWSSRLLDMRMLRAWRRRRHPVIVFIERHFHASEPSIVRIIAGVLIIAGALYWFETILRGVLTDGTVAAADRRLHNTLRLFHSAALHIFYSSVTNVASTIFVAPVALALAILFWVHQRTYEAKIFVLAIVGAVILSVALKYIVRRPRPPDAIAFAPGPSFPSGHTLAAAALYGTLVFLLLREKPRTWWHIVSAILLIPIIALVPFSRVYLGVHWPHDVTASLALGCAWLACLTTLVRFRRDGTERVERQPAIRAWPYAVTTFAFIVYALVLARVDVQPEARPALDPPRAAPATVLQAFPRGLRQTSEDLIGGPMEPLSFLIVGTPAGLQSTFERAGWSLADTPSATGLAYELWCVIRDKPDPHGPAMPAYYAEQPQDFTFERPGTPNGSIRHRHHVRIWRSPLCIAPSCTPLWVATCSYDAGIEFVPKPYLIMHRIDPYIDREREFIAQTMRSAGAADLWMIPVTGPRRGKNAGGDAFMTDGRAHVMRVGG